jgi:hypothetical protein
MRVDRQQTNKQTNKYKKTKKYKCKHTMEVSKLISLFLWLIFKIEFPERFDDFSFVFSSMLAISRSNLVFSFGSLAVSLIMANLAFSAASLTGSNPAYMFTRLRRGRKERKEG